MLHWILYAQMHRQHMTVVGQGGADMNTLGIETSKVEHVTKYPWLQPTIGEMFLAEEADQPAVLQGEE